MFAAFTGGLLVPLADAMEVLASVAERVVPQCLVEDEAKEGRCLSLQCCTASKSTETVHTKQ